MSVFGITTLEASLSGTLAGLFVGQRLAAPEAGTVSKITLALANTAGGHGACNCKPAIYLADGVDGRPGTRLSVASPVAIADNLDGWLDAAIAQAISAGTDYWFGTFFDADADGLKMYMAASGGVDYVALASYASPPDPFSGTEYEFGASKQSLYVTYTPAAKGLSVPVAIHHLREQGIS